MLALNPTSATQRDTMSEAGRTKALLCVVVGDAAKSTTTVRGQSTQSRTGENGGQSATRCLALFERRERVAKSFADVRWALSGLRTARGPRYEAWRDCGEGGRGTRGTPPSIVNQSDTDASMSQHAAVNGRGDRWL